MSEELEQYHQKGGDYVIPVEIMNYWIGEYEELKSVVDKGKRTVESYNLGKYDYSIPPSGIIELLEILGSAK